MTDFTDTLEATAASIEDLSEDLEAHLEDILGVDVTLDDPKVRVHEEYGNALSVPVKLDGLEDELADRLDAEETWVAPVNVEVAASVLEADLE